MTGGAGALIWLIVSVIFFVIEGVTVQLVTVWFALGALFAMLASFVGAPLWLQLVIFLITSIAVLVVGRPLLTDKLAARKVPTNADRVLGQIGIVKQEIDNIKQTGRVYANGLDWSARSLDGSIIQAEEQVLVKQIDGVKLIVERIQISKEG